MRNRFTFVVVLATMLALSVSVKGTQPTQSISDTYTWLSEFVSVDAAARTLTVRARVAYPEALSELKKFKAGEAVWVVWSGVSDYSDAVREFRRAESARSITEPLTMPAELVTPDATSQYVTLRVKVPDAGLGAIRGLKAGEWVTVTSRHRPATDAGAVVSVKPYSERSTTTR